MLASSPITPLTVRPGGFNSNSPPLTHLCACPPPSAGTPCATTSNSTSGPSNPFLPRPQRLETTIYGESVSLPSPRNQTKFLSPVLPKPANERLWKRGGGLRIVSVSLHVRYEVHTLIFTELPFRCLLGRLSQIHQVGLVWLVSV